MPDFIGRRYQQQKMQEEMVIALRILMIASPAGFTARHGFRPKILAKLAWGPPQSCLTPGICLYYMAKLDPLRNMGGGHDKDYHVHGLRN